MGVGGGRRVKGGDGGGGGREAERRHHVRVYILLFPGPFYVGNTKRKIRL